MVADYIHCDVCVDAGGAGAVLDGVECFRHIPDICNQAPIRKKVKHSPPDLGGDFFIRIYIYIMRMVFESMVHAAPARI